MSIWNVLWPTDKSEAPSEQLLYHAPELVIVAPEPPPAPPQTLSLEAARIILKQIEQVGTDAYAVDPRCQHCKGIHDRACPRVREMSFSPTGSIIGVKFWREWDEDSVLWPEDVIAVVMAADELALETQGE